MVEMPVSLGSGICAVELERIGNNDPGSTWT